jgi:hypothetical protein
MPSLGVDSEKVGEGRLAPCPQPILNRRLRPAATRAATTRAPASSTGASAISAQATTARTRVSRATLASTADGRPHHALAGHRLTVPGPHHDALPAPLHHTTATACGHPRSVESLLLDAQVPQEWRLPGFLIASSRSSHRSFKHLWVSSRHGIIRHAGDSPAWAVLRGACRPSWEDL